MTDDHNGLTIRTAVESDLTPLRELFRDTVLAIDLKYYSMSQLQAWASVWENEERWRQKFRLQHFFVAEEGSHIVGFCSFSDNGYLDLFYVHRNYQGQGIATLLLDTTEAWAKQNLINLLTTESSKSAYAFFIRHDFTMVNPQTVEVNGVFMDNFILQKKLK
jgi:putative acetyltransferase